LNNTQETIAAALNRAERSGISEKGTVPEGIAALVGGASMERWCECYCVANKKKSQGRDSEKSHRVINILFYITLMSSRFAAIHEGFMRPFL